MSWYHAFILCWATVVAFVVYRLLRSNTGRREQFRGTTYGPLGSFVAAALVFAAVIAAALFIRH